MVLTVGALIERQVVAWGELPIFRLVQSVREIFAVVVSIVKGDVEHCATIRFVDFGLIASHKARHLQQGVVADSRHSEVYVECTGQRKNGHAHAVGQGSTYP